MILSVKVNSKGGLDEGAMVFNLFKNIILPISRITHHSGLIILFFLGKKSLMHSDVLDWFSGFYTLLLTIECA